MTNSEQDKTQGMIPNFCLPTRALALLILAQSLALLLTLLMYDQDHSFWSQLGLNSLFIVWNACCCGIVFCAAKDYLNQQNTAVLSVMAISTVVIIIGLNSVAAIVYFYNNPLDVANNYQSWFIFRNVAVGLIITLTWLRYLYLRNQVYQSLIAEGEAQFRALQARIQPHFLFNTLNTIASLITIDQERAETTVEHLASVLRANLKPGQLSISLAQEIEISQHYLAIEQQRLGDKCQVKWQIEVDPKQYSIPPFTLQPLVENAVYHGIQRLSSGGEITIEIKPLNHGLFISVENPIPETPSKPGNQTAQSNIAQRMAIRYGHSAKMNIEALSKSYRVTLTLPEACRENTDNR